MHQLNCCLLVFHLLSLAPPQVFWSGETTPTIMTISVPSAGEHMIQANVFSESVYTTVAVLLEIPLGGGAQKCSDLKNLRLFLPLN